MYYLILRTASIVIICYAVQVTNLALKDNSREVGVERSQRAREQRDSRDSREPREPRDNRESRDPRESRDQRDDDRERDDREEPEDERERKGSKEARDPKEFKESRDSRDIRDHKDPKEKKEMTTPDVDEFLEKILKSDKIKQIADMIAEKAADKILKESKTREVLRSSGNKKEKVDEKESNEKDKHADEFDDDESLRKDKVPKIDAKAAMKKVSKFPDDNLSLNYKHFIADSVVTKESNGNIKHRLERPDVVRDGADENSDKTDKRPDKKTDVRSNPKFRESGEAESAEHKRRVKYPSHSEPEQGSVKKRVVKPRAVSEEESIESAESITDKETHLADHSKEEDIPISETFKAVEPNEPHNSFKKNHRASKSFSSNYTDSDTSDSDSDSNKVPIADVHSQDLPSSTMIRNEDGKLYAYSPSHDYDDYHEKLSSLLKSVQDKTIRKLESQPSYKEI